MKMLRKAYLTIIMHTKITILKSHVLGGTVEVVGGDVTIRVDASSQPTSLPARLFEVIPPQ